MSYSPEPWLRGVRVLDFSRLLPGPFCTLLLADMGANVIKVEDTRGGDYARYYPPYAPRGYGAFFASLNRNKRGVAVDLKDADGVAALESLVPRADVVVESFRPGVMERLGLGYERLKELNPGLVYCAITGYGQDGPMAQRAGHDINYLALSGLLEQTGARHGAPVVPGFQLADIAGGGLYAALGIVSALYRREQSGEGSFLDISMTEGALSLHAPFHGNVRANAAAPERGDGMLTGGVPCYGVYETADGAFLSVGALEPKFWSPFVRALGLDELATDNLASGERGASVRARVAEAIKARDAASWLELCAELDVCCEVVRSPSEALEEELFRARQMFIQVGGGVQTRTPLTSLELEHKPAPLLGEHTRRILGHHVDAEVLEALIERGVLVDSSRD